MHNLYFNHHLYRIIYLIYMPMIALLKNKVYTHRIFYIFYFFTKALSYERTHKHFRFIAEQTIRVSNVQIPL